MSCSFCGDPEHERSDCQELNDMFDADITFMEEFNERLAEGRDF